MSTVPPANTEILRLANAKTYSSSALHGVTIKKGDVVRVDAAIGADLLTLGTTSLQDNIDLPFFEAVEGEHTLSFDFTSDEVRALVEAKANSAQIAAAASKLVPGASGDDGFVPDPGASEDTAAAVARKQTAQRRKATAR